MEQPQYNMFHREKIEKEYVPLYKKFGLGTTIWSPLASGVLTGKYQKGVPEGSRLDGNTPFLQSMKKRLLESDQAVDNLRKVDQLIEVAKDVGCSISQLAIIWCLKNPNVSTVILGATKVSQLEENIDSLKYLSNVTSEHMKIVSGILNNAPDLPADRF
jgi:aryl-alcohol dehydrogenase-like predicted oxidoreductase